VKVAISIVSFVLASALPLLAQQSFPAPDRSKLPPALRHANLDTLSSGALMLLNNDNNLVQPAIARSKTAASDQLQEQVPTPLDPRVGLNIRLGDDPPELPTNMRAQAEPHIARSPTNPDFIAATFQEGRFTTGGAVDCGYSITHDGGLTWSRALIPNLTQAVGGPYFRATDPVAAVDLNGYVFLNTDAATNTGFSTGEVVISRSTDGGQTFEPPIVVYRPPSTNLFPDKNWMAVNTFANTATAGRIIVTFSLFDNSSVEGAPIARTFSDDAGLTWSFANLVAPSNSSCQGSQPVFLPDGKLAIVYFNFGTTNASDDRLEVVLSDNGGTSFGTPRSIAPVSQYSEPQIRTGEFLPSATGDRTTQNLYVVYQALSAGAPRILFTKSTNAGVSWSAPIAISDNPATSGVFNPAIAASPDGQTLTAVFYDHRANPGSTLLVDLYMAQSFDGGATWQPNIRLTSVSTDASLAPQTASGYMLGDYLGVAESTNRNVPAVPVWVDTRTGNPDPFVTRIGIAPTLTLASWQAARLSFTELTDAQFVHTGRELNISTRLRVQTGENVLIGGFIVTGSESKPVIIRGIGPSLANAGVQGTLADPVLELRQGDATVATNDNWKETQQPQIEASTIPPPNELESAIVRTLDPGAYTTILRGKGETTGVGLVEVYDLARNVDAQLANTSTRGLVGLGENVMIGGFIVGAGPTTNGSGSAKLVVRAIGPSLGQSGVSASLPDPTLELHDANGVLFAANDNWKENQQPELQATGLSPGDDRESAILAIVPPGNYTAVVAGKNDTTGVALVEIYNLQ
jgi:hypothetical protein